MGDSITDYYIANQARCAGEISRYERLIDRYSFLRLFSVILGILLFYQSLRFERVWLTELVILFVMIGFAWLVRKQSIFEKHKSYFVDLDRVNANELNSIARQGNIYPDGSEWIDYRHPYSSDLDIFGKDSLFKLINRCATAGGNQQLANWLKAPASTENIAERQDLIRELRLKSDWKLEFQARILFAVRDNNNEPGRLAGYLKETSETGIPSLLLYIRCIPFLFFPVILLAYYFPVFRVAAFIIACINLLIVYLNSKRISRVRQQIGKAGEVLYNYSEVFDQFESQIWTSPLGKKLEERLRNKEEIRISAQIKELSVLINRFDTGGMSIVGLFLNLSMVWNHRLSVSIENWKIRNQLHMKEAFDILSEIEALVSLSSLHSNCPSWCFPRAEEHVQYTLSGTSIGHPLIPEDLRVENDFSLNNELKIDIITGSNMSGKSTFLRTLGINTVLGLTGAPVCALEMHLTPMLVFSYMRITDSLYESTSTFKAELDRLKALLEVSGSGEKVYFLIDEMLRGTNSADKYLGSKAIIEKLISQKAVGAIATHDLQIAQLEHKYPDYIRNFYFDIRVEGEEMRFDYKLKEGECKTFNASMLLRRLGIYTGQS
jgi:hypothetical protein